jgi:hypothetical protein
MPQCQFPVFLLFLCFRKATQEIFSELDETKAKLAIFTEVSRSLEMRRRGARGSPHPRVARPRAWPRHQVVRSPGPPLDAPFRLYIPLDGKNLRDGLFFLETYCQPPVSSSRDRKDPGALPGTLPERGIPARDLIHHHGRLQSDV